MWDLPTQFGCLFPIYFVSVRTGKQLPRQKVILLWPPECEEAKLNCGFMWWEIERVCFWLTWRVLRRVVVNATVFLFATPLLPYLFFLLIQRKRLSPCFFHTKVYPIQKFSFSSSSCFLPSKFKLTRPNKWMMKSCRSSWRI